MKQYRQYKRIPDHIKVQYQIIQLGPTDSDAHGTHLSGEGHTENISEGGVLFESREPIPVASLLEIQITTSANPDPLFLKGRVVRVEEMETPGHYEIGVKFTHYFAKDREALRSHVVNFDDTLLPPKAD